MTWPIPGFDVAAELTFKNSRVSDEDAARQLRTVQGLIDKLSRHPGVILADEVGMGKTFVALGVALAAARTDTQGRPAVVMVPPSLLEKWPRDFEVFRELAIKQGGANVRVKCASSALDFLRLLDDPAEVRPQIIFLKHGAFHVQWIDHWVKFALIRRALRDIRIGERRTALPRFAADLIRAKSSYGHPKLYERLLDVDLERWKNSINYFYRGNVDLQVEDDPIPLAVREVFDSSDLPLEELCETLRELPARGSANINERLNRVRGAINSALREVWPRVLAAVRFTSPLLILDEAHHLKNPATKLASLFADPDAKDDAGEKGVLAGALSGVFERMLFLTATPFQLGHGELLNVLNRFRGVDWRVFPEGAREGFETALKQLSTTLDAAQVRTCELDERWRALTVEDCGCDPADESWWSSMLASAEQQPERVQVVLRAYHLAFQAMKEAEIILREYVTRHLRSRKLPDLAIERRIRRTGSALLLENGDDARGLAVDGEALLPFLLAARAQAIVAQTRQLNSRALFSEGLASSYEAFTKTRTNSQSEIDDDVIPTATEPDARLDSYLDKLEKALPSSREYARHPKMAALIERTLDLWSRGEKVVVFCHFVATGRAIEQHLSAAIEERLWNDARAKSGLEDAETRRSVEAFAKRFRHNEAMRPHLDLAVRQRIQILDAPLTDEEIARIHDVVARFMRTPHFVVRHFNFMAPSSAELLEVALQSSDSSGLTLSQKLGQFLQFITKRCNPEERQDYLDALDHVQPGSRFGRAAQEGDDDSRHVLVPNVRLANGKTDTETRQRLMLSFNTPFFPEILIASSVLAEGVDLHLNCRHMIHHDLSWNPSTIEQRTGRVDRIGAKAERVGKSIEIYLPFVGETQDEKQYRVVMDRERWFQALMGEEYRQDEFSTDQLAKRVPLPEAAARELAFDLAIRSKDVE